MKMFFNHLNGQKVFLSDFATVFCYLSFRRSLNNSLTGLKLFLACDEDYTIACLCFYRVRWSLSKSHLFSNEHHSMPKTTWHETQTHFFFCQNHIISETFRTCSQPRNLWWAYWTSATAMTRDNRTPPPSRQPNHTFSPFFHHSIGQPSMKPIRA